MARRKTRPKTQNIYDCAIIGGGPGGLMAALYLKRYWRSVVMFDARDSRLAPVPKVKTLPTFEAGVPGKTFLKRLEKQIKAYKPKIIHETAQVVKDKNLFLIISPNHRIHARKIIIATGMKDLQPDITNFRNLCKKGVLAYCPVCEGFDHRQEDIGIIVDSMKCINKIKFIAYYSQSVHLILLKKIKWPKQSLAYLTENKITSTYGKIEYLKADRKTGRLLVKQKGHKEFNLKMAYVELGSVVNAPSIKGLRRDEDGFIYVDDHQRTSMKNVFAIGDCVKSLSQIVVALGQAAIAATQIHNDLLNEAKKN